MTGPCVAYRAALASPRHLSVGARQDTCIEAVDYAPALRALAVVLADGRCAMCRAADGGLAPVEQLAFTHWVCNAGSGAQRVRIGAPCRLRCPAQARGFH